MGGNYVHLGDFNQDDQIMIILPEKRINESQGLEWISEIGADTEKIVKELDKLIKQHVPTAELELDWDATGDGGEYFCRVWLYDNFYDLYKYDKTFAVRFYTMDPETEEYYNYNEYRGLTQTRLLTVLLNELLEVNRQNLNESEEEGDLEWIKDVEADELSLSPNVFFRSDDEMYYTLDQLGYDITDMSLDTMCELAINEGYRWSDKHNGWYHRDEVEDFSYLGESTVDDLEWMKGPALIRFGDIKHEINDYVSVGDKIYLSGFLYLSETNNTVENVIILDNEHGVIDSFMSSKNRPKVKVSFGENITNLPLWVDNMGGDYVDLGAFESDDDILIILPQKNNINESEDLNWIENVPSNEIVKPWNGTIGSWTTPIYDRVYLYTDDGVTREVKVGGLTSKYRKRNRKGEWFGSDGDIRFYDASISDEEIKAFNSDPEYPDPFEGKYEITMSRREYNDNARKGKLILTPNKVGINESEMDFGWTDDFQWTTDMLLSMLENCNEIRVTNYNLQMDSPYIMRGEPTIYTLTRCEEWWDKFSQIPLDDNGRGPAEWYQDYDEGRIGVLASYEPNKNPREMDIEKDGWTITQYPQEIINSLNGKHSELFILLGKDGRPVYDLIPKKYRERVKTNWEDRFFNSKLNESEEDEFDWVRDVEIDLVPGQIYDIKTGNGYYWVPEKYIGRKWDDEHDVEMYKFKDLDGGGSGGKSVPYVKDLMKKGHIRLYDPNWSIKDELTFSDNIEDVLKGNFVIYFKDGVYLDQTLPIQDKLFEMGFSFYTKGPNEYITNKDSSDKIQFFESFNWDTSNPRYNKMPSDQWDKKKILLSSVKKDDGFRWIPKPNPRLDEQELFLTIMDHNAIVINGDKYVTNNINESEEFDWIQKQEPEKELKKSKRYVIDVSHLRPTPMRYSHDTSLTKQDILRKLEDLGYDVEHIDVDEAKYFYVEPTDGGPSWQYDEYGTPIQFDYWVDYNTDLMDDPTYGGKYQMINVDEFMFLIDNNLIGESEKNDFDWVRGFKPEYIDRCLDGRCMFLVCGDEEFNNTMITPINYKIQESKKPINESAGISFEARKWGEIIYDEIISNPEEKTRLIIDGYDYPETFDGFPIDYVVVDFYDRLTGYGQEHSGYDKDGNYVVLLYVQPKLVSGQGGYSLQSALNHEMKHAWEDYNRLSKGLPSIEQTKESQQLYNRDYILMLSDQNVRGPIKEILKYYYYLSNLEKSAYLENVYDQNPAYERVVREIASKDFESFKDRFDLDVNWHLMNTAYDIPFLTKFRSPREFIDYSAEELRSRALKMIKKINKMKYIHGKI